MSRKTAWPLIGFGLLRVRRGVVVVMIMVAALGLALPASAAGGNGASFCSTARAPTGSDTPWLDGGNPAETASWLAHNVGFDGEFNPGHIPGPGGPAWSPTPIRGHSIDSMRVRIRTLSRLPS